MSSARRAFTRGLASAMLAGEWNRVRILERAAESLGSSGAWLREVVDAAVTRFNVAPRDARNELARMIEQHPAFTSVWSGDGIRQRIRHWRFDAPAMAAMRWPVRKVETLGELAAWLELNDGDLDWLADRKALEHHTAEPRLQNYRYTWLAKRSGGHRLLEAPKPRLKAAQRRVLAEILGEIPPHEAAHGFRRGHSVITHARLHASASVVIRFDLRDFFAHAHPGRALGVFRKAGYPEEVAWSLIGLCTNHVPIQVLSAAPAARNADEAHARFHLRHYLSGPHLPQGAPTSPALANLVAFGLDVRLTAIAARFGATYSRYADDLTFSGGRELRFATSRLGARVEEIARDEGFAINAHKTRVMDRARRQEVTGIVVNQHLNVPRDELDRLKATLHNCLVHGPETQERGVPDLRAHLLGRIAWVEYLNPARGAKLRALFERIRWSN